MDPAEESIWRQYNLNAELYKHYLKLTIELNVFYYAITGAIVSYYLARATVPMMRFALLLPFATSVAFAGFFTWAALLARAARHAQSTAPISSAARLKSTPASDVARAVSSRRMRAWSAPRRCASAYGISGWNITIE